MVIAKEPLKLRFFLENEDTNAISGTPHCESRSVPINLLPIPVRPAFNEIEIR
jgi:hypothetical protein